MKEKKRYAVLGLGIFGSTVAKTLARADYDIIAIDQSRECVENVSDIIPDAIVADTTDIEQLKEAGIQDVDVAVVAMGSHLEPSILTILNLKELKVPKIISKANNHRYMYAMEKVGADKVIQPEKEMGKRIALQLISPNIIDIINIDSNHMIAEITPPKRWLGFRLSELSLRSQYGVNIIGVRKKDCKDSLLSVGPEYIMEQSDTLLVVADSNRFSKLDLD